MDLFSNTPHALPDDHSPATSRDLDSEARSLLDFLNRKAGKKFRPVPANIRFIVARLKEGATVADMRAVTAMKIREWKDDPVMHQYIRPATLYNATNYASYEGNLCRDP